MDKFGLVDAIEAYCEANNIYFIYGNDAYSNALADPKKYSAYERILIADFTAVPTIVGSQIQEIRYSGLISLGQKAESNTRSTLDETPIQKYKRRLKDLSTGVCDIIGAIACQNDLETENINMRYDMNKFDLNADFVACTLVFIQ